MMNQEDIFKKIGQILNELQDQYEFLAHNPQQLNELELELFLANANFLSDHVHIIRKLNNNKPVKELPAHTETSAVGETEIKSYLKKEAPSYQEQPKIEEIEKEELQQEDLVAPEVSDPVILTQEKPPFSDDLFKLDNSPSTFEFILDEGPVTDKFEFEEEKPVEDIFDRPLSKEEAIIIAQKQKLRDSQSNIFDRKEVDEVAPEPFLAAPKAELVADKVEEKEIPPASTAPIVDKIEEKIVLQPGSVEPLTGKPEQAVPTPATEQVVQKPAIAQAAPIPVTEQTVPNASRPTLNDLLASKRSGAAANLNAENDKPPITDLKRAINLNEKLLYIKDLFNGYNLAYSEAVDLINKMPDFKTADAFLQNNYAEKNNWQAKQATVNKFYELLKQRFKEA